MNGRHLTRRSRVQSTARAPRTIRSSTYCMRATALAMREGPWVARESPSFSMTRLNHIMKDYRHNSKDDEAVVEKDGERKG